MLDELFLYVAQLRWNMQGDGGLCEGTEMLDGLSLYVAQLRWSTQGDGGLCGSQFGGLK
jgi:hypothetical protein